MPTPNKGHKEVNNTREADEDSSAEKKHQTQHAIAGPEEHPKAKIASAEQDEELEEFINCVVGCMVDKKALAIRVIDLQGVVDYCDRLVVCSAGASRQVSAIADHIHGTLKKEYSRYPSGVEGRSNDQWVVMDYGDVMIHVFSHDARAYYAFDELWLEAKLIPLSKYGISDEGAIANPEMARYM